MTTDLVFAGVIAGLTAIAATQAVSGSTAEERQSGGQAIVGGLSLAAPFAISAAFGNHNIEECKAVRLEWEGAVLKKQQEEAERLAAIAKAEDERRRAHAARIAELRAVPIQRASIRIDNKYADSIFKVRVELPDSEEAHEPVREVRVEGATAKTFDGSFYWRPGQRVSMRISAMSLGQWHDFTVSDIAPRSGGIFDVVYDWDMATAEFRVRTGWAEQAPAAVR